MRAALAVLFFWAILAAVCASAVHGRRSLSRRHARYVSTLTGKNIKKRCTPRSDSANTTSSKPTSSSVSQTKPSSKPSTSSKLPAATSGIITVVDKTCGPNGATTQITKTTGPNGSIDWLNCGINSGGWTPPMIKVSDITFVSLSNALQSSQSPYKPCSKYISLFEKYGAKYGVPPIVLAAIAMQESTCNPNESGGGLMQISSDKCGGAPNGNCNDVNYNIETATKFFADTLRGNNGNMLLTLGQYNGWFKKLTFSKATAAANSGCCTCQNNLDYLHQVFNGWLQNIDPRVRDMGKYFNLAKC